ncbi:hypothetical protein [Leisingera caerulea]|uniref:hypothetical protein n=1 Tax=Leisingera caerulea TaxID=506591 RepID=UPI00041F0B0F|nr:hypothetical protein [Leisingera caerulea]
MSAELDELDLIEMLTDRLANANDRIKALEDTVFVVLRIFDTMEGDKISGALKILADSRRKAGNPEIAAVHEENIDALAKSKSIMRH